MITFIFKRIKLFFVFLCLITGGMVSKAQTFNWVKGMGNTGTDYGYSVALDKAGNIYVTGHYSGRVDFNPRSGTDTLKAVAGSDIFLAKYDAGGNYIWARSMGGATSEGGYKVAVDGNGGVYVTGHFTGLVDFDPGTSIDTFRAIGSTDVFLVKFDTAGNYEWGKAWGNNGSDYGHGVAADEAGNVYVTGYFYNTVHFGPGTTTLTAVNGPDIFLAKFNPDGKWIWAHSMGAADYDYGYGVALDGNGHVYMTGLFSMTVDFNPVGSGADTIASAGTYDIFIAKYDTAGNYIWAKGIGGTGTDFGRDIAVDSAGNAYITGYFAGTADFDPGAGMDTITATGIYDVFIAKYDKDGNHVWANKIDGSATDFGYAIALRGAASVYVTGGFSGTADFDPGPDTAAFTAAGTDIFVAKYDSSGTYVWAKQMGGSGTDIGYGLVINEYGNAYITGSFQTLADFNPGSGTNDTLRSAGGYEIFVLKLACSDQTLSSEITDTTCDRSYVLNGVTYTRSGTYQQFWRNASGCDSIVMLNLVIAPVSKPELVVDGFLLSTALSYSAYQWLKDGDTIHGATNNSYLVTENNKYSVVVTNEEGCTDTSDIYEVNNLDVHELQYHGKFLIYPNPASDKLYISAAFPVNIVICGVDGKQVIQYNGVNEVNITMLPDGVYFARITDKDGVTIHNGRFVKNSR